MHALGRSAENGRSARVERSSYAVYYGKLYSSMRAGDLGAMLTNEDLDATLTQYVFLASEKERAVLEAGLGRVAPEDTARFLQNVFCSPHAFLENISRVQFAKGISDIVSVETDMFSTVICSGLPFAVKESLLESVYKFFSTYLCSECSGRLQSNVTNLSAEERTLYPFDTVCYMWWDFTNLGPGGTEADAALVNQAIVSVQRRCLYLPSEACIESGLHGLSHWMGFDPQGIADIIGELLLVRPEISPALRQYAEICRVGMAQ